MYYVNAVNSFTYLNRHGNTGNGEKKLYLSSDDSLRFLNDFLGRDEANGVNVYLYNNEPRERIICKNGFIRKSNLQTFLNQWIGEYSKEHVYDNNLERELEKCHNYLNSNGDKIHFSVDCGISENRVYIGSPDRNWRVIPQFAIPNESRVCISENNGELEFELV